MFELGTNAEIDRLWFCGWQGVDLLVMLWRNDPNAEWVLRARLRVHVDSKVHDSADRKFIVDYEVRPEDTVEDLRAAGEGLVADTKAMFADRPLVDDKVLSGLVGVVAFTEAMQKMSFVHTTTVTPTKESLGFAEDEDS